MPRRLTDSQRQLVIRLLTAGHSVKDVIEKSKVSRPTVNQIADSIGIRPVDGRKKPNRALEMALYLRKTKKFTDNEIAQALGFASGRLSQVPKARRERK